MLSRRNFLLKAGAAGLLTAMGNNAFAQGRGLRDTPGPLPQSSNVIPATSYVHPTLYTGSTADVGLAIVCAIDISGSVSSDTGEFQSQVQSLANAIASDDFRESIFYPGGPESVALCVIDFESNSKLQIPWVDFRENDRHKFLQFAEEVMNIRRRSNGGTDQSSAMENAAYCYSNMPFGADNKALNIMTDGTGNATTAQQWNRILAQEHEATVYALTTNTGSTWLNEWCEDNLITPSNRYTKRNGRPLSGGFVHEVATERQTQITRAEGGNMAAYNDQVLLAFRRQVILQTASLDIIDPRQCHEFNCTRLASANINPFPANDIV